MRMLSVVLVIGWLAPAFAGAQEPVASGSSVVHEANGLFAVHTTVDVFANPDGGFDYIYQISNAPRCSGTECSVLAINSYKMPIGSMDPDCPVDVSDVGLRPGTGDAEPPTMIVNPRQVIWDFPPYAVAPGESSVELTLHSVCGPGPLAPGQISLAGEFAFDAQGDAIGPSVPPDSTGPGLSCSARFWKRQAAKPDAQFQPTCDTAADLSFGYFADCDALLAPLLAGRASKLEKAEKQLSALLLSLGAGVEFPDNTECRLFPGNAIIENSCSDSPVSAETVGDAVDAVVALLETGLASKRNAAKACAADINAAIGVADTVASH